MIKGIFFVFLILFSIVAGVSQYAPCAEPISYSIGTIDDRFNISKEEVIQDTAQAAKIWGTYDSVPIFEYNPESKLTINLVYDERQQLTEKLNNLDSNLDSQKKSVDARIDEFKRLEREFNAKVEKFNEEVSYWNSRGGAPSQEYDRLNREQESLQQSATQLNALAAELNTTTSSFNDQIGEFNNTVDSFNTTIHEKPEQGVFDGATNRIDIYFSRNKDELIHTLAHELGHARGLGHLNVDTAIMSAFTNTYTTATPQDFTLLNVQCRKRMYFELLGERIQVIAERFQSSQK